MKRHKMGRRASRKNFTKHGSYTHKRNVPTRMPMRGGIRL